MSIATFFLGLIILIIIFQEYRKFFLFSFISLILLITFLLKNHKSYDYDIIESTPFHLGLVIEKKFQCDENSSDICSKTITTNPEFVTVIKNFGESVYGKLYKQAYRMWLDHKITGIGLNNFESLCEQKNNKYILTKENYGNCGSHPHNFYLQWLVESGMIGFNLFLIFVIMLFKKLLNNSNYTTAKIGLTSLIVIFWPITSTGSLLKNWYGIEMFFVIGLSIVCTKKIFKNIDTNN